MERSSTGRLAGKVAIVTGGARGQGAAHAECLARDGAVVLAGDVRNELGEETAEALRDQGLDVTYQPLDVTSTGDWAAAIAWAEGKGRLDVLSTTPASSTSTRSRRSHSRRGTGSSPSTRPGPCSGCRRRCR